MLELDERGSEPLRRTLWTAEEPLARAKEYLKRARDVSVSEKGAELAVDLVKLSKPQLWGRPYLTVADGYPVDDVIVFSLAITSQNFCFWDPAGGPDWRVDGGRGANALVNSFVRANIEGLGVTDPSWYRNLSEKDVKDLFQGDSEQQLGPPLIRERTRILNELGDWLTTLKKPSEMLLEVEEGGKKTDAFAFAQYLGEKLEGFRDVNYLPNEKPIPFLKRAQMYSSAVGDLLGGKGPIWLRERKRLTAFADYREPQGLRHVGVINYSQRLAEIVDNKQLIEPGSIYEAEIRTATIVGLEELRKALAKRGYLLDTRDLDAMMWVYARTAENIEPYHRCLTIWY